MWGAVDMLPGWAHRNEIEPVFAGKVQNNIKLFISEEIIRKTTTRTHVANNSHCLELWFHDIDPRLEPSTYVQERHRFLETS